MATTPTNSLIHTVKDLQALVEQERSLHIQHDYPASPCGGSYQ